jgi:uncharacterized protein YdhG (YjbR/CyaY superfamily)
MTDNKGNDGFTAEEKAAIRQRALELKAESRANNDRTAGESAVLAAITVLPEPDRTIATKIHEIVKLNAPELIPRTWYGFPAYAKGGKIVCFYQSASKFKTRYGTLGFQQDASLDDGNMWPVAFAVMGLGSAEESKIAELVKKAVN